MSRAEIEKAGPQDILPCNFGPWGLRCKGSFCMANNPSRSAFSSKLLLNWLVESLSGLSQGSLQVFCRTFGNFLQLKPIKLLEFWYPFCLEFYPRVRLLKGEVVQKHEAEDPLSGVRHFHGSATLQGVQDGLK